MVISKMSVSQQSRCRTSGLVLLELVVALGIISAAMLPLAFSFIQEQRLARAYYFRAVAMEIIDGEMEVLVAGEWESYPEGTRPYVVRAAAAASLPAGQFVLTRDPTQLRLEWRPGKPGQGGPVSREIGLRDVPAAHSGHR
jgi:hypothetical protein